MKAVKKSLFNKVEFRSSTEENGKRIIEAIIPYNSKSQDLGGFREVITETAFKRSISQNKNIFAYYNHDDNKILGSTKSKTLELRSEDEGLHCKLFLGETSFANDCWDIISRNDCNTLSFAFIPFEVENRSNLRYLKSVDLIEVSFCVSQPAYIETNSIAYSTRKNIKENKNMKNNSLITRSINLENLEQIFSSDKLITDKSVIEDILSFIDPEVLKEMVLPVEDLADGKKDSETEEKENKEDKENIPEKEKTEILEMIEQEIKKENEENEEKE
jgi:HK97 family phage prohead protease